MVNKEKKPSPERIRLDNDERRIHLLALGRRLFGEHTYDELSISDIAIKAGISKGLLYHYFPTKRLYYIETIRAAATELYEVIAPRPGSLPHERLLESLNAYLKYVEDNDKTYVSLLKSGVGVDPEVGQIVEETRARMLGRLLRELSVDKNISAEQSIALYGWLGLVEGATLEWIKRGEQPRSELALFLARQLESILLSTGLVSKLKLNVAKRFRTKGFLK